MGQTSASRKLEKIQLSHWFPVIGTGVSYLRMFYNN